MKNLGCKLAFVIGCFVSTFCGCKTIYKSEFVPIPRQSMSGPIEIGTEWVEIVPPKPLIPYGKYQTIFITNQDFNHKILSYPEALTLLDGQKTKIEAILYDDKGEAYSLEVSRQRVVRSEQDEIVPAGFDLGRVPVEVVTPDGRADLSRPDFPEDRTYTKLRIRSEIVLKCQSIEWTGDNPSWIR
jgi:hypothetical protein